MNRSAKSTPPYAAASGDPVLAVQLRRPTRPFGRMYSPRTGQARLALRPCWGQDPRKIVSDFARLSAGGSWIRTFRFLARAVSVLPVRDRMFASSSLRRRVRVSQLREI